MALNLQFKIPNRKYEVIIILHPDATELEQKELFKKHQEVVKNFEGTVFSIENWGKRRLANPIKKLATGNYFHMTYEAKGSAPAELERLMRINDKVLRFSHTRIPDKLSLSQHLENFKTGLVESIKREQEREAKAAARRKARTT